MPTESTHGGDHVNGSSFDLLILKASLNISLKGIMVEFVVSQHGLKAS